MKISIKGLSVSMEIKNKGAEFDVYDGNDHKGDLYISKAGLTWCKGKTHRKNGAIIAWDDFIGWAEGSKQTVPPKRTLKK
jgi:hypothetical protein